MSQPLPQRPSSMTPTSLQQMGFEGESIAMQAASELASELFTAQQQVAAGWIAACEGRRLRVDLIDRHNKVWGLYALGHWHPESGSNASL